MRIYIQMRMGVDLHLRGGRRQAGRGGGDQAQTRKRSEGRRITDNRKAG